jgi:membrane-bound lytic murein transglycosylase D
MHRNIKVAIIILLLTSVVTTSSAMETSLKAPIKLYITQKSIYKLQGIPFITSEFPDITISSAPASATVNKPHYAFNYTKIKRAAIEELYKTYGFNKAVKRSLYFYSKKFRKTFRERLSRARRYIETMAEIFIEKGLPPELVFLPLIESGFNPYAYSPKRAAGPWQFIPATAKKYGLKIDWWVDERRDPIKATIAAAEYLKDLYEKFGSWNLALAGYNAGEGKIIKALRKVKKRDYWVLRKTRYIKRETKNYVPSYIAATAIAIDPESFGFGDIAYHEPFEYDEVEIDTPMDLGVIAKFTGVDVSTIRELNPELRRWCTPPNVSTYILRIPPGTKEMFLHNLSNAKDDELFYVKFYRVKRGDTVGKIARRFGVPVQAIIDVNSLGKKALIIAGESILIPINKNRGDKEKIATPGRLKPILKSKEL